MTKIAQPTRVLAEEGLLYEINRTVLWPLGLALGVSTDSEDDTVVLLDTGEVIVDVDLAKAQRFHIFARDRVRSIRP